MKTVKTKLLTIATLLCSTAASAHDFEVDGIYYNITSEEDLTVEVTYRGDRYNSYSNEYTGKVIIPKSVTYNSNTYSVTSIENSAFSGCSGLTSVTIPNSVTSIGRLAFYECDGLSGVHITDLEAWFKIIFGGIESNPLYYARHLYLDGEEIKDLVIPESVTNIGDYAFRNCSSFTRVTIPNSVTSIGYEAFCGCSNLTSITIPSSVTNIGLMAFGNCYSLTSVHITDLEAWCKITFISPFFIGREGHLYLNGEEIKDLVIPESVTSIGRYAFDNCSSLTSVTIPNSVTSIGSSAFSGCRSLTSVTIPNSVTSIGYYAFSGCSSLTEITIGNSVTSIGSLAFEDTGWWKNQSDGLIYLDYYLLGCKGSKPTGHIKIKEETKTIGGNAFSGCSGLTSITIPNSVMSIGDQAFSGCSGLTSITIPNSVTSIGYNAFYGCSNLKTVINFSDFNFGRGSENHGLVAYYAEKVINADEQVGDFYFRTDDGIHYLSGYTGTDNEISFPENYNGENYEVGNWVFANYSNLTNVTIPNSVTGIGSAAFRNCSGLTNITIPNSVTSIGSYAFENCSNLKKLYIEDGDSILTLSYSTGLYNCPIETLYLGRNLKDSRCSFSNKGSLMTLTIGPKVTKIENNAFSDCSELTSVAMGNSVVNIGNNAFANCSKLTNIVLPDSLKYILVSAFSGCTSLANITIPGSVIEIHDRAFSGCLGFTSITIPSSVSIIADNSFEGCVNIKELRIEDGDVLGTFPSSTSKGLFYDCPLETLYLGRDIESSYPAYEQKNLTSVTIGNKVTNIWEKAFYGCSSLANITIPNSVTNIGEEAFYGCSNLANITISNSVITLGDGVFRNCSRLANIIIPNSVKKIGNNAFNGCTNLKDLHIEDGDSTLSLGYELNHNNFNYQGLFCSCPLETLYLGRNISFQNNYNPFKDLKTLNVGEKVTNINFRGYKDCTAIAVSKNNAVYDSRENCNAIIETNSNTLIAGCISTIIPNSVTRIGNSAFYGCSNLTNIPIPASVTSIGDYAFSGCSGLTSITIPNSVTDIGEYAFANTGLEQVNLPESIKNIRNCTFNNCSKLTTVTISNSVERIGIEVFCYCGNLKKVTIGSSVFSIKQQAFAYCNKLQEIVCHAEIPPTMGERVFHDVDTESCLLKVPAGSKSAYQHAEQWNDFYTIEEFASSIDKILLDEATTADIYTIDGRLYMKNADIKEVNLPRGLYIIGGKKVMVK